MDTTPLVMSSIATQILDLLVSKGVVSKSEAKGVFEDVAKDIRRAAEDNLTAEDMAEPMARIIEFIGNRYS